MITDKKEFRRNVYQIDKVYIVYKKSGRRCLLWNAAHTAALICHAHPGLSLLPAVGVLPGVGEDGIHGGMVAGAMVVGDMAGGGSGITVRRFLGCKESCADYVSGITALDRLKMVSHYR